MERKQSMRKKDKKPLWIVPNGGFTHQQYIELRRNKEYLSNILKYRMFRPYDFQDLADYYLWKEEYHHAESLEARRQYDRVIQQGNSKQTDDSV